MLLHAVTDLRAAYKKGGTGVFTARAAREGRLERYKKKQTALWGCAGQPWQAAPRTMPGRAAKSVCSAAGSRNVTVCAGTQNNGMVLCSTHRPHRPHWPPLSHRLYTACHSARSSMKMRPRLMPRPLNVNRPDRVPPSAVAAVVMDTGPQYVRPQPAFYVHSQ
jgi:hypothetical protein